MADSWIDPEDDEWLEVIDYEGEDLGFLLKREASKLGMLPQVIETPDRYLTDPWVQYHAQLAHERDLFKGDLNDVQIVLLGSRMIKEREMEANERERVFEERFFVANPEGYQEYKKQKDQKAEVEGEMAEVEQRTPRSVEEFLAAISAFGAEEPSDSDKEQDKAEGWLTSLLDDSDLDQMSDES